MKRKLLLAALCVASAIGGGNFLHAQTTPTNYVAGWDGGSSTGKPTSYGWASTNSNRSWGDLNGGGARMTTSYSNYKYEDGSNYPTDNRMLWIRYADNNADTYTYTFTGLEAGHFYSFSGLVGWHNNSSNPTFTVAVEGTSSYASASKSISTKQKLYNVSFKFVVPANETATSFKLKFTSSTGGDCMEAISALKLVEDFEVYRVELSDRFIPYATAVNGKLNNSTLATAISTAQEKVDDTSSNVTFDDVANLKTAISTAILAYSLNPVGDDVTSFIFRPGFEGMTAESANYATVKGKDYSSEGWTMVETGDWGYGAIMSYGSDKTFNGVNVPATDNAGNTGNTLGVSVGWGWTQRYQSEVITLPAGSYRFSVKAYNANANAQQFTSKVGFVPTSGVSSLSTKTSFASNTWETDEIDFVLASDTEGRFQVGGQAVSGGSGDNAKIFFDNISLTYFDPLKLAQIQWQEVHDELAALDATLLPDAAEEAVTTELAKAVPTSTVDDVNAAKTALQDLIDSYDGIKASYDKVNALITLATSEMTNSTGTKTEIEAAISTSSTYKETRTTAADLDLDYSTLEAARQAYVTSGAQPTFGHSFDWTFKMDNPDFEDGTTDWTNERNTTGQYNYGTTPTAMQHGTNGLDVWAPQINYINVYQSQTLPAGVYELSAYVFSSNPYKQHVYAHNGKDNPSADLTSTSEWQKLAVTFINTEDVSTKLGLYSQGKNQNGNTDGWFRLDNFQLLYQGNCASATMKVKAGQWGTFIAPFDVAIPDGVNAYTVTGVNANDYMVKEAVETTILANTPVLLENTTETLVDTTFYGKNLSDADSYTKGLLTGIYTAATIPAGSYVLQTPKSTRVQAFYPLASDLTGGTPNRCYLTLSNSAAKRNAIFFDKEEGTTGIEAPNATNGEDGVFYNLAGQRVNRSYKGIIIHNRKAKLNN